MTRQQIDLALVFGMGFAIGMGIAAIMVFLSPHWVYI